MAPTVGTAIPKYQYGVGCLLNPGVDTSGFISKNVGYVRASAGVYQLTPADPTLQIGANDGRLRMMVDVQPMQDTSGEFAWGISWVNGGGVGFWRIAFYSLSVAAGALVTTPTDCPFQFTIWTIERNYASTGP